jgi:hypothetical protein
LVQRFWVLGSGFEGFTAITTYLKQDILQYLIGQHPAAFFCNAVTSVLPVQMVAFGTLGSIAGYWLAVYYNHWRKHA